MGKNRQFIIIAAAIVTIIIAGTIGYSVIEGWTFIDSFYMTIITLSTVGFQEVHPLSVSGRIFTIFLILGGTGTMLYAATALIQYILDGNLGNILGRRRVKVEIAKLKGHTILCGYGKVGKEVARVFENEKTPFVIIEADDKTCARATEAGFLCLNMNASSDEALKEAGILNAKNLVAALGSDADNLYITLSAKSLKPDIFIVARIDNEESEAKLKRAAADRTMSPYGIGGRRLAMMTIKPLVVDFVDTTMDRQGHEFTLEDVKIAAGSVLDGISVKDSLKLISGAHILAIKKKNSNLVTNPAPEIELRAGDELALMGTRPIKGDLTLNIITI
jgi:voltage-gated potassium channel